MCHGEEVTSTAEAWARRSVESGCGGKRMRPIDDTAGGCRRAEPTLPPTPARTSDARRASSTATAPPAQRRRSERARTEFLRLSPPRPHSPAVVVVAIGARARRVAPRPRPSRSIAWAPSHRVVFCARVRRRLVALVSSRLAPTLGGGWVSAAPRPLRRRLRVAGVWDRVESRGEAEPDGRRAQEVLRRLPQLDRRAANVPRDYVSVCPSLDRRPRRARVRRRRRHESAAGPPPPVAGAGTSNTLDRQRALCRQRAIRARRNSAPRERECGREGAGVRAARGAARGQARLPRHGASRALRRLSRGFERGCARAPAAWRAGCRATKRTRVEAVCRVARGRRGARSARATFSSFVRLGITAAFDSAVVSPASLRSSLVGGLAARDGRPTTPTGICKSWLATRTSSDYSTSSRPRTIR